MSECQICGSAATGTNGYRCNHCDDVHCGDHRLPENHNCAALRVGTADPPKRDQAWKNKRQSGNRSSPEPVDVDDNRTPSNSSGTSSGRGSPDLNPDGTIARSSSSSRSSTSASEGPSLVERLRDRASRHRWKIRWLRWKAGFFLGITIIVIGLANFVTGDGIAGLPTIDFYRPLVSYALQGSLYATGVTQLIADLLFVLVGVLIYLRR